MTPADVLRSLRADLTSMAPRERASLTVRLQQRATTDPAMARLLPHLGIMK